MVTKKKQSKIEKGSLKSKNELLQIMSDHLSQQQEFALLLKEKAIQYIDCDESSKTDIKMKNHYLNAYNNQVEAVSRTSSAMIKVYGSSLQTDDEKEEVSENLVD